MSGPYQARVPEATVFVNGLGKRKHAKVVVGLIAYGVHPVCDSNDRHYLSVFRYHSVEPVDIETRAIVLERLAVNLIQWTKP